MTYKVEQIESYIKTTTEYVEQLKLFFFGSILERDSMLGYWSLLFFLPLKLIKDNLYYILFIFITLTFSQSISKPYQYICMLIRLSPRIAFLPWLEQIHS